MTWQGTCSKDSSSIAFAIRWPRSSWRRATAPVLIKNLLRWSKISMLDTYGHVMTDEKLATQGSMLERIMPKTVAGANAMKSCCSRAVGRAEKPMNTGKKYGRHEETRTPDLYRVNLGPIGFKRLTDRGDCLNTRKSCKASEFVGWVVGWKLRPGHFLGRAIFAI